MFASNTSVIFFDILQIMPLGCATPKDSLVEVLREADFVSLHVPGTPETREMIGEAELAEMKPGSYLLNASRGNVVGQQGSNVVDASSHMCHGFLARL